MVKSYRATESKVLSGPLMQGALTHLGGLCIVVDDTLHIVAASERASEFFGEPFSLGLRVTVLIQGKTKRSIDRLAARGQSFRTLVRKRVEGAARDLRLIASRITPVGESGWVLTFEPIEGRASNGPRRLVDMWSQDRLMLSVLQLLERVATERSPVLVRGETGSGKSLAARTLHVLSGRGSGPYVVTHCATQAAGSLSAGESLLARDLNRARGGTWVLDEVFDLTNEQQAELVSLLGDDPVESSITNDVRIIATTSRHPSRESDSGRVRGALIHRLGVFEITIPPLRARPDDVVLLTEKMLAKLASPKRTIRKVAPAVLSMLHHYAWPGNVRELENILRYAYAMGDGEMLAPNELPASMLESGTVYVAKSSHPETREPKDAAQAYDEIETITHALQRSSGNRSRAAQVLGVSRITLWRRMRALGMA
ncbi:MAG: sigma 54-interacting transcriptional regulator [Polyangiaceae bacterium]